LNLTRSLPRKLGRKRSLRKDGFRFRDWLVIPFEDTSSEIPINWRDAAPDIWERLSAPDKIIKQDHRSLVGLIEWQGRRLVVKKFLLQRDWWWFRLTSILFPSLGEIACRNALLLNRLGILTPPPLLLMQRLHWGQVVDSWMIYPFVEELSTGTIELQRIVGFLKRMHRAGWIHGDSHPANFLDTSAGLTAIDPLQARACRLRYFQALDVVHLNDDRPGSIDSYGCGELGRWIAAAQAGRRMLKFYRDAKHRLREIAGMSGNNCRQR